MTYRELLFFLKGLTDEQLDCNITVEDPFEDECYPAEFRIADIDHSCLDEDHPVIFIKENPNPMPFQEKLERYGDRD